MSLSKQNVQIAQKQNCLEVFFFFGDFMIYVPVLGIWGVCADSSSQSNVWSLTSLMSLFLFRENLLFNRVEKITETKMSIKNNTLRSYLFSFF